MGVYIHKCMYIYVCTVSIRLKLAFSVVVIVQTFSKLEPKIVLSNTQN